MDEVINCIKSLIVINFIFDAAIFIVIFLILCFLHDITGSKSENNPEVKKETVYAIKCIGRKPTECKEEWFTINQEYVVRNGQVFDDIEVKWYVFRYDKTMLEAGGYLFCKVAK